MVYYTVTGSYLVGGFKHFFHNISAQIITTSPDVTPEIDLSHWIKDTKGFKVSSFTRNGEKHG